MLVGWVVSARATFCCDYITAPLDKKAMETSGIRCSVTARSITVPLDKKAVETSGIWCSVTAGSINNGHASLEVEQTSYYVILMHDCHSSVGTASPLNQKRFCYNGRFRPWWHLRITRRGWVRDCFTTTLRLTSCILRLHVHTRETADENNVLTTHHNRRTCERLRLMSSPKEVTYEGSRSSCALPAYLIALRFRGHLNRSYNSKMLYGMALGGDQHVPPDGRFWLHLAHARGRGREL